MLKEALGGLGKDLNYRDAVIHGLKTGEVGAF